MRKILILATVAALAACTSEEEPIANKFEREAAEIENKAAAFENQVENEVSAAEARLDREADELLNTMSSGNAAAEANAADANAADAAENQSR